MGPTGFIVTLLPWLEQTLARNDPLSCLFLFNKIRRKLLEKYYLFHFLKYFSNTLSSPLRLTSHNSTIDIETQRLEQRLRNQIRNTNGNIAITVLGFWAENIFTNGIIRQSLIWCCTCSLMLPQKWWWVVCWQLVRLISANRQFSVFPYSQLLVSEFI